MRISASIFRLDKLRLLAFLAKSRMWNRGASAQGATGRKFLGKRKIGVTGLRGIPGIMGGVETHCEELLSRLSALDFSLAITVFGRTPYLPKGRSAFGHLSVVPLPAPRLASFEAIFSTFLGICYARRAGFHLVHIHGIGPGLLAPLARLLGMRVIVTHHGADYERAKWGGFARLILRLGEFASLQAANRVICVAPSIVERMRLQYPAKATKLRYLPNGTPHTEVDQRDGSRILRDFGLSENGYILSVGRLVPEKGFDYLIDAHLLTGGGRILVIAGAADHQSPFVQGLLCKAGPTVRFIGFQTKEVLAHLYRGASLFILPSFHEGLPLAALEAAREEAPMLLSDIPANLDIGLPAGNYFPVGNVAALKDALKRPRDAFKINSADIGRRFDWDVIAADTLEVYRELY